MAGTSPNPNNVRLKFRGKPEMERARRLMSRGLISGAEYRKLVQEKPGDGDAGLELPPKAKTNY